MAWRRTNLTSWTLMNKHQCGCIRTLTFSPKKNVVCKRLANLFRPLCVKVWVMLHMMHKSKWWNIMHDLNNYDFNFKSNTWWLDACILLDMYFLIHIQIVVSWYIMQLYCIRVHVKKCRRLACIIADSNILYHFNYLFASSLEILVSVYFVMICDLTSNWNRTSLSPEKDSCSFKTWI